MASCLAHPPAGGAALRSRPLQGIRSGRASGRGSWPRGTPCRLQPAFCRSTAWPRGAARPPLCGPCAPPRASAWPPWPGAGTASRGASRAAWPGAAR
eukprot:2630167-Alexandrium_andersonii.AAC.1